MSLISIKAVPELCGAAATATAWSDGWLLPNATVENEAESRKASQSSSAIPTKDRKEGGRTAEGRRKSLAFRFLAKNQRPTRPWVTTLRLTEE